MIPPDQLRDLDRDQRAELLRQLVELQAPSDAPSPAQRRFRDTVRVLVTAGAVLLVPWTAYLALTLPRRTVTDHWRGAWVGFDVMVIAVLTLTAWLGWHRRQMVAIGLTASSVLLVCDAWFDVMLTQGPDRIVSVVTAALVEIPVAVLFARAAANVFRFNAELIWTITGRTGRPPPLHRLPLLSRLAHHEEADG